ncbi:hypothetical protein KGM_215618 [Danaus plexippus plexippus]|uniref:Uncharacterized protein n=1 Tax=Danaus plexippus plexippus TaxID=278856 RepID=A0A212F1X9_DANPL|nr:hypothetical protein KGM_215618 [Danaus plexippus plexippus]
MHTMDTLGYGHKKYRPPLSPANFYQHDFYSRHATLRPQIPLYKQNEPQQSLALSIQQTATFYVLSASGISRVTFVESIFSATAGPDEAG